MIAPQNQQPTVIDAMIGTKSEWYNAVDEAVRPSEVLPGNYEYSTTTSYGNSDNIPEGDSTKFDIACERYEIISLDNSYITLKQEIPVTFPAGMNKQKVKQWAFAYKCTPCAIGQYRIETNADGLQAVNQAHYEWFILYNSVSDVAKENSDVFTTWKKVQDKNPLCPMRIIDTSAMTDETTVKIQMPEIRIPLSSFLLLFNMKYYPNWAGKMTLEVYPTFKNICVCPIIDSAVYPAIKDKIDDGTLNLGFYNLNQSMKNGITESSEKAIVCGNLTFKCTESTTTSGKIKLARQLLRIDVFNALAAKYIQVPLMFPIQTCQCKKYASPLKDGPTVDSTLTLALKHCDAMFTVFEKDNTSTTCFENPEITYSFNVDGKYYPREAYKSVDDVRSINMTFDALNINNSYLTSIPFDLRNSLQPYYRLDTASSNGTVTSKKVWSYGDRSNGLIGIAFADDDDFMGGISTNSTVQIQLKADRIVEGEQTPIAFGSPVGIFYEDKLLKIRACKPEGGPQITITNATIEQIVAGVSV